MLHSNRRDSTQLTTTALHMKQQIRPSVRPAAVVVVVVVVANHKKLRMDRSRPRFRSRRRRRRSRRDT